MGWFSGFRLAREVEAFTVTPGPAFAVDEIAIPPEVFGLTSYASPTSPAPRVDRRSAIQVPAVKRSRDLIAGGIGQLPLLQFDERRQRVDSELLSQPEAGVPRTVTMTRLVEDMLFESVGWWQILGFVGRFPWPVKRLEPREVIVDKHPTGCPTGRAGCSGAVSTAGKHLHDQDVIEFPSPNDALLVAGARAIRTCLSLDAAASRYADEPVPTGWFTPADEAVQPADEEVTAMLDGWAEARRTRSTAYIPSSLAYNSNAFSPSDLQLADGRQHAVLELARVAGVDPEDLGVSTTSRTYANQFDRRKAFTDFTLGAYMSAIQDRLSMDDVTPAGQYVRFQLDEFLRSDPETRYRAYAAGLAVGAIDQTYIDEQENKPTTTAGRRPVALPGGAPVAAARDNVISAQFADDAVTFDQAPAGRTFEIDREHRIIRGMAVPYGVVGRSRGREFRFGPDSLAVTDVSRSKLWIGHNRDRAVGVMFEQEDRPDGKYGAWRIARGAAGDEALTMAEDGVWDGLSVGLGDGGQFVADSSGVFDVIGAPWTETSLTPAPAFDNARVHSVAASATALTTMEGSTMPDLLAPDAAPAAPVAPTFSLTADVLSDAIRQAFAGEGVVNPFMPQAGPERATVTPGSARFEVREELPYRFDGTRGEHGFVADLRAAYSQGDSEARTRLEAFMGDVSEVFAVTTGNVGSLNPTQNRPELYVPNLTYTRPLFDAVTTGTLTDQTPFTIPKFSAAAGLVANHVQGTEPTPGSFSATNQTVTPAPKSGKIEINREVWDQGGSPQADGIIWAEMLNAWYESIEAAIAALLNSNPTAEVQLTSAVDAALVDAVTAILIGKQYARGGNRFTRFVADQNLFTALVNAKDTAGRKLLPVVNPTNAQGSTTGGFDAVYLGSLAIQAAWALNTSPMTQAKSHLFVPSSVWCWVSAPQRFTFEYQVKSVDMAIWGYVATACTRDADVQPVDYTVTD